MKMIKSALLLASIATPSLALAHSGHESTSMLSGLAAGALHPLLGLDHLLALLLAGGLASQLQGQQRWLIPLAFVGVVALGFFSAHAGLHAISAGTVEALISSSLVVGALLLVSGQVAKRRMSKTSALSSMSAWIMTGFAAVHGFAHGLEVPAGAALSGFGLGFLFVSACLIVAVILSMPRLAVKPLLTAEGS